MTSRLDMGDFGLDTSEISPLGVPGFALVTGAGSGIGKAIVHLLARERCNGVLLADLNKAAVESVKEALIKIATHPQFRCIVYAVDVSKEESVGGMVKTAVEAFGHIDYAVNCAGIGMKRSLLDTSTEDWNRMTSINLSSVFFCMKHEIEQMRKQDPIETDRSSSLSAL